MDQPNKTPDNLPVETPDISFQVMPQEGGHYTPVSPLPPPIKPTPPAPQPMRPGGMPPLPSPAHNMEMLPQEPKPSIWRNKWLYIIGGIVILLVLGLLYYFLIYFKKTNTPATPAPQTPVTKLPKVWLSQYFGSETCSDQTICGDTVDSDSDGLNNYDEFKAGTSPTKADTDSDGLADGDEAHIYKTDPTLKFTDRRDTVAQNDWSDGFQIKSDYDPLTPGLKFSDDRKTQIVQDTSTYALHEPTITTLK